ncbi:TetR family transcriptional regulator, partial [Streptomyces albidoflavus]
MNAAGDNQRRSSRAVFPEHERAKGGTARAGRSPELHQERAVQTRLQVLEAAALLFDQRGYAGTSIKDVADEVGMTKGAVYFHYPTKEALTIAVVEAHYARWPLLLQASQSKGLGPMDTLVDL